MRFRRLLQPSDSRLPPQSELEPLTSCDDSSPGFFNGSGNAGSRSVQRPRWSRRWMICTVCFGTFFILLNTIYLCLFVPKPPPTLPDMEPWQVPKQKIYAVTFMKEEAHGIVEVVLNHISQGVDHVILIDNMSDRKLPLDALNEMKQRGFVTLMYEQRNKVQKSALRRMSQLARTMGADWILGTDADEFTYATQLGSFQNYLTLLDDEVCSVAIQWHLFGSDGREDQPNSVLQGFLGRGNNTMSEDNSGGGYKTVSRMDCTMWAAIHQSAVFPRFTNRRYAAVRGFPRDYAPNINELSEASPEDGTPPDLVMNHYKTQSHQKYVQIKMTRGNAINNGNIRNETVFLKNDRGKNQTRDTVLADRAMLRFPALYNGELALQTNHDFLSPWPLENVISALNELERHQVLVIIDAASHTLPDTIATATRNAAMLDPTMDCMVRIPPGHVAAAQAAKLTRLCAAVESRFLESQPHTIRLQPFEEFVRFTIQKYSTKYKGYLVMDQHVVLSAGIDTTPMRLRAMELPVTPTSSSPLPYVTWDEDLDRGVIHLLGRSMSPSMEGV